MQAVLKSPLFHLVIVILVAVDALIVLFELFLDFGAFRELYIAWKSAFVMVMCGVPYLLATCSCGVATAGHKQVVLSIRT